MDLGFEASFFGTDFGARAAFLERVEIRKRARDGKVIVSLDEYRRIYDGGIRIERAKMLGIDVGLGKTVEGIVAIAQPGALPALIVTLTHLPRQWEREIHRFAPQLSTYILQKATTSSYVDGRGQMPNDLARYFEAGHPLPDVVICSYSKLAGWAQWLATHLKPKSVIWDEVQEFRNGPGTQKGNAACYLAKHIKRRLGLSATPIHNSGSEIYNVLETINPGALGTRQEFHREWCSESKGNVKEPAVLGSYLRERGLFIRRTKADVGRELPPLTISEQFVESDPKVLERLNGDERAIALARFVLGGTRQAWQAAGEFDMFGWQQTGVAKAPYVAAFVDMLLQGERPVVLYGWHHEVYDVWRVLLKEHRPVFFTGRETEKQKQAAVDAFVTGATKLFIISLRSGAGIDGLQRAGCTDVIFGELDWSPAIHEQAIGRVRRDGILDPVTAWFMVSDEGSDPQMAEVLGIKRGQLEGIRDPNGAIVSGQTDPDALKRVAEAFLKRSGVAIPERAAAPSDPSLFGGTAA